jgi:hypothetical protein
VNRLLDNQTDSDGRGEVIDDVAFVDELSNDRRRQDGVDDEVEAGPLAEVRDILDRAGREVVEGEGLPAIVEKEFRESRSTRSWMDAIHCPARDSSSCGSCSRISAHRTKEARLSLKSRQ